MLDARIPLGVQPMQIEPRSNMLMRAAQLQGQKDQNALRQMQMAQIKAQAEEALRARAAQEAQQQQMNAYLQSMSGQAGPPEQFNPARAAQMFGIDGAKKMQDMMTPKQDNYKVVGGSLVQVGPNGVTEAYRAPEKPAPKSALAQLMAERDALPPGDPRRSVYDAQIRKSTTHAPAVQVNTGQKDRDWGAPPKDHVWARDAAGNVMTERDPKTNAFRPIATPIGGSDQAAVQQSSIATMTDTLNTLDKAINHPGRTTATGISGIADPRNVIPGTDAMNFKILADQIGGKAFLQAFESLKGGGQITEVEGRKATDAIARLNRAQSDEEYLQALQDFRDVVASAYKRATGKDYKPAIGGGYNKSLDDLLNKYGN